MYSYLYFITAVLVPFTSAQHDIIASSGTGPGPSQNASYFEEYNQSPNATGTGYLRGANTSFSNPWTADPVSWDTRINVTEVQWIGNQTVTNTVISLSTPDNILAANSSWDTCVVLFTSIPRNVTVKGQDDTGDCKTMFTDDCMNSYTTAIESARVAAARRNATGACGGISFSAIPDQCAGSLLVGSIAQNVTSNQTDGSAWMFESSDAHDSTNLTCFEEAVTRVWPMMLIQSPSGSFEGGSGLVTAQMSCLRARNVTSGSKEVDDVPGTGNRVVHGGWALLVVMGAVGILLLLAYAGGKLAGIIYIVNISATQELLCKYRMDTVNFEEFGSAKQRFSPLVYRVKNSCQQEYES
ncbi:hypothetical protein SBOR_7744 [Sclerotinia borealis F-4128]|uniref:Uncharacterized protein n=1 Tax=Sclerotinia borealis (strain F-4128) TaxID=1432307 RepID=W9CAJ0_SCLBF|nr:hypothetical protein SBOR_7744 [Sclerotinia borealis F-4128]